MRIVQLFLFFIFLSISASAQKVYFIYLESENNKPFYVKMGDQLHSSNSGYLLLSQLLDSSYQITVGFPGSKSQYRFLVPVTGRDRGFLVKSFDYGLGLFDLQKLSVIKPMVDESKPNISYRSRTDDFTTLLAKASNDSSLFIVPITVKQDVVVEKTDSKPEEKKSEEKTTIEQVNSKTEGTVVAILPPVVDNKVDKKPEEGIKSDKKDQQVELNIDSMIVAQNREDSLAEITRNAVVIADEKTNNADNATIKTEVSTTADNVQAYRRSVVKKHAESSTSEGFGLVFYDTYDGGADTIRLLIPNPKVSLVQSDASVSDPDNLLIVPKDTILQKPVVAVKSSSTATKTNCKSIATNSDFFKLRKTMAAKTSDDGMVGEAKKIFKNKCFTTDQVKNLGSLFLTSAGKYQFFDAAYLHVTDRDQFASLQSEITDVYYLKRFKALVGE